MSTEFMLKDCMCLVTLFDMCMINNVAIYGLMVLMEVFIKGVHSL